MAGVFTRAPMTGGAAAMAGGSMIFWTMLGLMAAAAVALIALYNGLVKGRQLVSEGWSGIDVQLQRRADLVPNLVSTVEGYAGHERDLLREVTELRARAQAVGNAHPAARADAEQQLGAALGRLIAVAEGYPDLKASANFVELQQALADIEDALQLARRYYNGAVRQYNTQVQQFPSNLVAGRFGFHIAEFFALNDPADAAVPRVRFGTP